MEHDVNMENPIDIKAIFIEALNQTISNYAEKTKLEITQFILHICGELRPYMLVTETGAETLADEIFTNDLRRDFIFNLLFNFCPRLSFSNTEKEFSKLISGFSFTLALGDTVAVANQRNNNANKLPEEIITRLPNRSSIVDILEANKWLMMILLISMYITVDDFKQTEQAK